MANNRMALVCRKCKKGIAIAKYYPRGGFIAGEKSGWGQYPLNQNKVNEFFVKHSHNFDKSFSGEHQYYLGYEDKGKWQYDKSFRFKLPKGWKFAKGFKVSKEIINVT